MNGVNRTKLEETQAAAEACMATIRAAAGIALHGRSSPLFAMADIVDCLTRDPTTSRKVSVVCTSGKRLRQPADTGEFPGTLASAWPLRFDALAGKAELPLIYITSSETSAELCSIASESNQRGILCNDIETLPSRWPKGAHPWLPLWLLANPECQPFDPSNAAEVCAITMHALRSLYVEGQAGFYYMALHDHSNDAPAPLTDVQANSAVRGMYRLIAFEEPSNRPRIRLLGAGLALTAVLQAAQILDERWGVNCEVWSCPSYTRLARDAESAKRWNRFHPCQDKRSWHLRDCLGESADVVVAVTGYPQAVVEQLRAHIEARFVGIGADWPEPTANNFSSPESIAVHALRALADDGQIAMRP